MVLIMASIEVYVIDDTETQGIMSPDSCLLPVTTALLSPSEDDCQHLEIQPLDSLQSDLLDNTRQVLFLLLERLGSHKYLIKINLLILLLLEPAVES